MALLNSLKSILNFSNSSSNCTLLNNNQINFYGNSKISKLPPGYFEQSSFQTKGFVVEYPKDGAPISC
ncbi:hypothetical protein DICPUDRAFT_149748 [Dictyostelium purpureum]|uniref:Uncharacterized protein n=1 Tax=Dictyostelium purpureum TaxID=5786 RepID=F0ZEK1_DICPU|nr:uncharacterized protein DICPUDRAFT_149748 [Dictyostelium purpureum]EGC37642.1 hypothetical protein DICPUDRAFT_149748 [Dictyostelium purpureum]|eukprot:XP_003285830.1 hypothetical protein DICPUDRAFT_149748 [Dictyostelium purpureum]